MRMKNFFLFLFVLLFLASCDDDFKVGADYKEVTVVYGLLDHGSLVNQHYIKITKGFYSDVQDNFLLALNKDSLYYNDLTVTIEELSNGNVTQTFNLTKVDIAALPNPIIKREGIFLDSPNYAYQFIAPLDPSRQYRLRVVNNETGKVITGETNVINTSASIFRVIRPFTPFPQVDFANPELNYTFSWVAPANSELFDIIMRFHYSERDVAADITVKKYVDLPLARFVEKKGTNMSYRMDNETFYSLLTSNIGAADANTTRRVDTSEVFFIAGDAQMKQYIDVNNAQGGLTNDQIKPIFTNLSGENVLGIFASRGTRGIGFTTFTDAMIDSIINGSRTRNLNFVGVSLD